MAEAYINLCYLVSSALFIIGLKCLGSPRTARTGNLIGSWGMLIAIAATLLGKSILSYELIIVGIVVGSFLGVLLALLVKMTAMPQMVGLLNGFGGAASLLVAGAQYMTQGEQNIYVLIGIVLSVVVGAVTFTGSVIAAAKLQELISGRPLVYPLQKTITLVVAIVTIGFSVLLVREINNDYLYILSAISGLLGILLVLPIGGGDMPVVICLLNSYSGMAAMFTGFTFKTPNAMLIITGSLVGASGIILTAIMCKAMNRSIWNVIFGGFGQVQQGGAAATKAHGNIKSGTAEDVGMLLDGARLAIIVPGYGMAVAQAQHVVKEFSDALMKKGVDVKYAIHPVAGRMPGHMNVLLAEANVPYDQLYEMDKINPQFSEADLVLVVGANDITNPSAKTNQSSPLFGMPILEVDRARAIVVLKRSMNPGFAGVDNELYYNSKCMMLFGDAKKSLTDLISAVRQ